MRRVSSANALPICARSFKDLSSERARLSNPLPQVALALQPIEMASHLARH